MNVCAHVHVYTCNCLYFIYFIFWQLGHQKKVREHKHVCHVILHTTLLYIIFLLHLKICDNFVKLKLQFLCERMCCLFNSMWNCHYKLKHYWIINHIICYRITHFSSIFCINSKLHYYVNIFETSSSECDREPHLELIQCTLMPHDNAKSNYSYYNKQSCINCKNLKVYTKT